MSKKNVIIFSVVILFAISVSYFMFEIGVTNKLEGRIYDTKIKIKEGRYTSDLPVINMVINSSGEKIVNDSVALTVKAKSNYNIIRIEYSTDLKNWKTIKKDINSKDIMTKLVFNDSIYGDVYIRVINEEGYRSYAYKTSVKIDKVLPKIRVYKEDNDVVLKASDNVMLSSIQYSNDKLNWEDEKVNAEAIALRKNDINYKYVRVVDSAGNISSIKNME